MSDIQISFENKAVMLNLDLTCKGRMVCESYAVTLKALAKINEVLK